MSECIEWQASRHYKGYGTRRFRGKLWKVHRLEWTLRFGEIPDGLHVLHTCDNPPCYNIDHLFLGTNHDNVLDKIAKGRHQSQRKTHCKRGHPLSGDNLAHFKNRGRVCLICHRTASREAYRRKANTQGRI